MLCGNSTLMHHYSPLRINLVQRPLQWQHLLQGVVGIRLHPGQLGLQRHQAPAE